MLHSSRPASALNMAIDDDNYILRFRTRHARLDLVIPVTLRFVIHRDGKPAHVTGTMPITFAINKRIGLDRVTVLIQYAASVLKVIQRLTLFVDSLTPGDDTIFRPTGNGAKGRDVLRFKRF